MLLRNLVVAVAALGGQAAFAEHHIRVGTSFDFDTRGNPPAESVAEFTPEALNVSPGSSEHDSVADAPGIAAQSTIVNDRAVAIGGTVSLEFTISNTGF